jgi:sucrose phosphorylase
MVNHISQRSTYFQDFIANGEKSKYADLFLRFKKLAPPHGEIPLEIMSKVYTRKPRPPYFEAMFADGSTEKVWCTFDYEQIDLDVNSPAGQEFVRDSLIALSRHNIKFIRVDAFGYTIKKLGTNCFFVEPDTSDLLARLRDIAKPFGAVLLPEIHEHHSIQLKLASQGYYVYDFALPVLVLQALYEGMNKNLLNWFKICPRHQFTTLDTHDGLPIVDVVDLMTEEEIERTKENLYTKGANVQKRYSVDAEYKNLDVYQINCTYYSALGDNDDAYITARAIQIFAPGIPQIYHVGLLAGRNDVDLMERTKFGRNINRHSYSIDEVDVEVARPVVQRLMALLRFRNEHSHIFDGEMTVEPSSENEIIITWNQGTSKATLRADLKNRRAKISCADSNAKKNFSFEA